MAHLRTDFLMGRRLLLAAAPAFFAAPALAKLGPELLTGSLANVVDGDDPAMAELGRCQRFGLKATAIIHRCQSAGENRL